MHIHAQPGRLHARLGKSGATAGLGVNVHFPPGRPRDLQRIQQAGFRVIRTDLLWAQVETARGQYDWAATDALLLDLEAHGLHPLLILAYSNPLYAPRLAGRPASPSLAYAAPQQGEARAAFMEFARLAASRYQGRVAWEVWNEPDHNFGLPVDLRSYIDVAGETCRTIREQDSGAVVLGPAASGFLRWFLEAFIEADRAGCFDALSVHPYRDRAPEDVLGDWASLRATVQRVARAHGRTPPTVVNSEWGYSSTGGAWTQQRQADYVTRLWLLDRMAGIPLSIIYDWWDDGPDPSQKEASFGLVDHWGHPKPVHAALSRIASALRGLEYRGRLLTYRGSEFLLAFGDSDRPVSIVIGWNADAPGSTLIAPRRLCLLQQPEPAGRHCPPGGAGFVVADSMRLDASPRIFSVGGDGSLRLAGPSR
jgi:hypothetical protein